MPQIALGNVAAQDKLTIPETGERVVVPYPHIEQSTTIVNVPADWTFSETLLNITQQLWPHMSSKPPAWVACDDDPGLQAALARAFQSVDPDTGEVVECGEGVPEGWENIVNGPPPALGDPMQAAQRALESGLGYVEGGPQDPAVEAAASAATAAATDPAPAPAAAPDQPAETPATSPEA